MSFSSRIKLYNINTVVYNDNNKISFTIYQQVLFKTAMKMMYLLKSYSTLSSNLERAFQPLLEHSKALVDDFRNGEMSVDDNSLSFTERVAIRRLGSTEGMPCIFL